MVNKKQELIEAIDKLQDSQVVKFNNRVVDLSMSLHRSELRLILKEDYQDWNDDAIDALFESLLNEGRPSYADLLKTKVSYSYTNAAGDTKSRKVQVATAMKKKADGTNHPAKPPAMALFKKSGYSDDEIKKAQDAVEKDGKKDKPKKVDDKPKVKKALTKLEKARLARIKEDTEDINKIKDPDKRFAKMKEKSQQRRQEIYEGKDLPAGNAGSTLGEMGGGMAAEDIGDPDNPNISQEDWVNREYDNIMAAEGKESLKAKLCAGKSDKACEKVVKDWLNVAYKTGLNELNTLKSNPKYKAKMPQPSPYPSGQIMDYHGKAMVENELNQRKEQCATKKDPEACRKHYDTQLQYLDKLEETDTGVMYMMDNGEIGFKHTSNKKSLKDPHNNKSIGSKKVSMESAAQRQKDRGVFDDKTIDTISTSVQTSMDEANEIVTRADRQASADVNDIEDKGKLVEGAGSLMNKLPGRASTKGDDYSQKIRDGKGYGAVRTELERMGLDPKTASDDEILEATLNILEHGNHASTKAREETEERIANGEKQPIKVGKKHYRVVEVDGKKEVRECDAEGKPVAPNDVGKLIYKTSELIKTTRKKAAKVDPPLTKESSDEELEKFGSYYTPPLSAEEVRWTLFSEEADTLENTNDDRKSGMDRAHKKVVGECKKQDQNYFNNNPEKAKEMGWKKNEEGEWVPGPGAKNGPATQQYVDSYMEDMHWNRYIDGDHDGVGDMSINGQNVDPKDFRTCLAQLSGYKGDPESPEGKKALKKHLREQTRISAEIEQSEESDREGRISQESQESHISFDTEVDEVKRGKKTGRKRKVSVGEETYRSKGVGVNSVLGGLGADMQTCLQGEMDKRNK